MPAVNYAGISAEMRALPQWCAYKLEMVDGKLTKVPYKVSTGARASSTNPSTWTTFNAAQTAYQDIEGYDGICFMLSKECGIVFIDLDNCINADGTIEPWAKEIVELFKSYTEKSQSGKGLHLLIHATKKGARCSTSKYPHKVEIYDHARQCCTTGNVLQGYCIIETRQDELDRLYLEIFGEDEPREPTQAERLKMLKIAASSASAIGKKDVAKKLKAKIKELETANTPAPELDDDALILKATLAKNGNEFKALWDGSTLDYNGNESGRDQALCNKLAFWTNSNAIQMDRLFRQSECMRSKWDEMHGSQTYGQMTIEKAIADTKEGYGHVIDGKAAGDKPTRSIERNLTIEDLTIVSKIDEETGEEDRKFSPSRAADSILEKIPLTFASWEVEGYEKEPDIWTCQENGFWSRDGDNLITELCDGIADDLSTHRNLAETKRRIRSALRKNPIEFDTCNSHLVGTANGWACDLITGQVRRVTPEDHISTDLILPVDYDPQARCSQIFGFYDSICSDNCSKMAMIDDDVATLDLVQWQYIQLRLGLGGNGKGERQKFRRRFFGRYSIASIPLKDLNNDGFAISELFRKRAVDCGETTRDAGRGEKYNTALLKRLTGDDDLAAPRKYKSRLPFVPFCKVTIDANSAPKFDDDSRGFTRRFRRINLPYFFTDLVDQRDPTQKSIDPLIHKRITSPQELSGYLNVLLERAKEIVKDRRYPSCDHLTKGYQEQVYSIDEFVDKFCEVDSRKYIQDGWYVKAADLFKAFEQWASLANASPSNPQAFGRAVGNLTGIKSYSRRLPNEDKPVKAYIGIQFDVDSYCEEITKLKNRLNVTDMLPNCNDINSNESPCDQCNQLSKRYLELKEKFGQGNPVQISKEDSSEKIGYIGNIGNTKAENTDSEKGIGHKNGNISVTAGEEEACKPAPVDLKDGHLGNVCLDHSESVLAYIQNGTGMLNNNDAELNELQPSADSEATAMTSNQTTSATEDLADRMDETGDTSSPQDDDLISNEKDTEPIEMSPWTRRFIDQKLAKYGRSDPARGRRGIPTAMLKEDELKLVKNNGWTLEKDDDGTDIWWTPAETLNETGTVMGS